MIEKLTSLLQSEGLYHLLTNFTDQGVTDSILGDLSDADLKDLGVEKLGERKRLLAAFKGDASIEEAADAPATSISVTAPASLIPTNAPTPTKATKESPFVNTLGMPFVPIPRFETRFCVWPVRVQDYEAYCIAAGAAFPSSCPFPQDGDHPIVGVTWKEATAFCAWLTKKERADGKIDSETAYRLPTDLEWSAAVGLPHEPEATPGERHLKLPGYPWGLRWPPPQNAGNYENERVDQLGIQKQIIKAKKEIDECLTELNDETIVKEGYKRDLRKYFETWEDKYKLLTRRMNDWKREWTPVDDFEFTSNVGSFSENQYGIFDLGGNVWEWCKDTWSPLWPDLKVLRGASYATRSFQDNEDKSFPNQKVYLSAFRIGSRSTEAEGASYTIENNSIYYHDGGFRIVLASGDPEEDAKSILRQNRQYFIHTNLFQADGSISEEHFSCLYKVWEDLDADLLNIANAFFQSKQYGYAEAFYRVVLEGLADTTEVNESLQPAQWIINIGICMPDSRVLEKIDLLNKYYNKNSLWANILRYNLACYNCLAGNLEVARALLLEKFRRDKQQLIYKNTDIDFALKDEDLIPIREFLQEIKNREATPSPIATAAPEVKPEVANVFWNPEKPLCCLKCSKEIHPEGTNQGVDIYQIWYSSNEDRTVHSRSISKDEIPGFTYYKFCSQACCAQWVNEHTNSQKETKNRGGLFSFLKKK